jgi:hypothetical protein
MSDNPPPDPSMPPQATEAATPKRTQRTVLLLFGLVLVLAGGVGGYLIYRNVDGRMGSPEDAVAAFYDDIQDGDYSRAYDRTCDELKAEIPEDEFTTIVIRRPFTSYKIGHVGRYEEDGIEKANVIVRFSESDGGTSGRGTAVIRPGFTWQICI